MSEKITDIKQYAAVLGMITIRISQIDWLIGLGISHLCLSTTPGNIGAITDEINSISVKLTIFESLGKRVLSKSIHSRQKEIVKKLRSVNSRRNRYVHALWILGGVDKGFKPNLLKLKRTKNFKHHRYADIKQLRNLEKDCLKAFDELITLTFTEIGPSVTRKLSRRSHKDQKIQRQTPKKAQLPLL